MAKFSLCCCVSAVGGAGEAVRDSAREVQADPESARAAPGALSSLSERTGFRFPGTAGESGGEHKNFSIEEMRLNGCQKFPAQSRGELFDFRAKSQTTKIMAAFVCFASKTPVHLVFSHSSVRSTGSNSWVSKGWVLPVISSSPPPCGVFQTCMRQADERNLQAEQRNVQLEHENEALRKQLVSRERARRELQSAADELRERVRALEQDAQRREDALRRRDEDAARREQQLEQREQELRQQGLDKELLGGG